MIAKQYDLDTLKKILESNLEISKIHVRYNINSNKKEILDNNANFKKSNIVNNGYYYYGNDIQNLEPYQEGIISIQDFSSQLVGQIANPKSNIKVLDMCAAPGTKTMQLAELMYNQGEIIAYDIYDHKLNLIKDNAHRLKIDIITAKMGDASKLDGIEQANSFDLILCDALCTGLGVIKRKPEIKYQNINEAMDYIIKTQSELLEQAYRLLKVGGILVYSTCTINKKENEYQIKDFRDKHEDMFLESQRQILGYEQDGDGFYIARMIKTNK
jgi:16S rRNA (cytosine967-C5)-methyltransferase